MPFRFNAKRVFLTYPRCGSLSKDALLEFLRDSRGALWYCVALEQHEDGGNHLHAYAEWPDRLDVRDERHFDLDGYHPNVQSVRNRTSVLKYVQKGGDHIGNCEATSSTTTKYGAIIAESTGVDDFLARIIKEDPRGIAHNYERLLAFGQWRFKETCPEYIPSYTEFNEPTGLSDWVNANLTNVRYLYITTTLMRHNPMFNPKCEV